MFGGGGGNITRVFVKKMTHLFFFIAFPINMLMIIGIPILNDDTLRIPKW